MRDRPSFKKPPLIEVVCQIQFEPLSALQAPYTGFFWQAVRDEFPRVNSVPPLAANAVGMPGNRPAQVTIQIGNMPELPRIWFIAENDSALIQLQQDRFIFNWKRLPASDVEYPRYPKIIERFRRLYGIFEGFLAEHQLGAVSPLQLELTYINHITPGIEIGRLRDIGTVLPDLSWRTEPPKRFLPEPSALNFRSQFPMSEGNLTVGLATAKQESDGKSVFRLDIAARGLPADNDLWRWFDSANTWVVDAFVDLTSEEIQKSIWKRV